MEKTGKEFLRLAFKPSEIRVDGVAIPGLGHPMKNSPQRLPKEGYRIRALGNGDYSLIITRTSAGLVTVK